MINSKIIKYPSFKYLQLIIGLVINVGCSCSYRSDHELPRLTLDTAITIVQSEINNPTINELKEFQTEHSKSIELNRVYLDFSTENDSSITLGMRYFNNPFIGVFVIDKKSNKIISTKFVTSSGNVLPKDINMVKEILTIKVFQTVKYRANPMFDKGRFKISTDDEILILSCTPWQDQWVVRVSINGGDGWIFMFANSDGSLLDVIREMK
jgi:hypothetical protein